MDEIVPNARVFDEKGKAIAYDHVGPGDSLKIIYKASRDKGWIKFSPAFLYVWLNGQPLTTLQKIVLTINEVGVPYARITIKLTDIDIDADTLTALAAIVKQKAEGDGEGITETD
jgi:hypothetical protein